MQPEARGKFYWDKGARTWMMYVESAQPLPAGKTYELWIVTAAGVPDGVAGGGSCAGGDYG